MASPKADSVTEDQNSKEQIPKDQDSQDQIPKDLPNEDQLKEAAAAAENAIAAQGMANKLKDMAATVTDPTKREKMLKDAYNKEMQAHGSSKKAGMLQSGAFRGTIGGAGIGGAVSAGVGILVGTVVGGATAIPATGLGALVGTGVGAIHGPFIKLGSLAAGGGKGEDKKDGAKEGKQAEEQVSPDPTALRQAADALAEQREKQGLDSEPAGDKDNAAKSDKKKPRKIEVRSGGQSQQS